MMRTFGAFRAGDGALFYGEVMGAPEGSGPPLVRRLRQPFWLGLETDDASAPIGLDALTIGVPVAPGKMIAVGLNYHAHAKEQGKPLPTTPLTWLKAPTSLLPHEGCIEVPYPQHRTDFEAELAIVIGRRAKNVPLAEAEGYVFGYTTCLDITDRDLQNSEKQFARSKSFDTFTPVGPFVYHGIEAQDLAISLRQNGELRQESRTSELIFKVGEIISFCSQGTTLEPGDLILTGTPAGVAPIREGDTLETRIGPFAPLIVRVRHAAV